MTRSERGSLFTVEELGRKRWSFTVRAHTESEALQAARICGFGEPATVTRVEEDRHGGHGLAH
jgi:hypothetical protein